MLDWQDPTIALPTFPRQLTSARFLTTGSAADFAQNEYGFLLKIPPDAIDPYDTVVELDFAPATTR